jgi:hypothetical protein
LHTLRTLILVVKFINNFSFIGYIKNRSLPLSTHLNNVSKFWIEWLSNSKSKEVNHVLVDALIFHPRYLSQNFALGNLLRKGQFSVITSLIRYQSDHATKEVSRSFGINNFASCYKPFNITVIFKAIAGTLVQLRAIRYEKSVGISVIVDGVDVGEFIYDEYLRLTNLPTKRSISIDYIAFIYRSLYLYYRYRQLLQELNITDIVIGHTVYATWGMLLPAAKASGLDISVYNWCDAIGTGKVTVTRQLPSNKVRKPGYMKSQYLDLLLSKVPREQVLTHWDCLMSNRLSGKVADKDSINVFNGIDINRVDSFLHLYSSSNKNGHVFIYAHAFVDAVKYSRWTLYSDYYTWLEETLLFLASKTSTTNIYIKPHPSEHMYACDVTTEMVVDRINSELNSSFIYLDKKVSNEIVFNVADSIITACGTINIEAACYGIPVILAAEFGNENLGYTFPCKSLSEYHSKLTECEKLPKLGLDKVFLAKAYFCWYLDYMYLTSAIFALGSIASADRQATSVELEKLNEVYGYVSRDSVAMFKEVIEKLDQECFEDIIYN